MAISRILVVVVIGALLLVMGLTIYNVVQTTTIGATLSNGYAEQRAGERNVGENYAGGKLDQHDRITRNIGVNYAGGKLDQHERLAPNDAVELDRHDANVTRYLRANTEENYAGGKLDQHERIAR